MSLGVNNNRPNNGGQNMKLNLNENIVGQIKDLASQAYGHDSTKAGLGRIGMIGDHVVKFNTHHGERNSTAGSMDDMRASCDALRKHLGSIARNAYGEGQMTTAMKKILAGLGVKADGTLSKPINKDLLTRKSVVKFIRQLEADSSNLTDDLNNVRGSQTLKHSMLTDVAKHTTDVVGVRELRAAQELSKDDPNKFLISYLANFASAYLAGRLTKSEVIEAARQKVAGDSQQLTEAQQRAADNYIDDLTRREVGLRFANLCDNLYNTPIKPFDRNVKSLFENRMLLAGKKDSKAPALLEKKFNELFRKSGLYEKILNGEISHSNDPHVKDFMVKVHDELADIVNAGFLESNSPAMGKDPTASNYILGYEVKEGASKKSVPGNDAFKVIVPSSPEIDTSNTIWSIFAKRIDMLAEAAGQKWLGEIFKQNIPYNDPLDP